MGESASVVCSFRGASPAMGYISEDPDVLKRTVTVQVDHELRS